MSDSHSGLMLELTEAPQPRFLERLLVEHPVGKLKKGDLVFFLGEIPDMPGHWAVVSQSGQIFPGFHSDRFRLPRPEEL